MLLLFGLNILLVVGGGSLAQHSAYSLQTAVDALNRREMMQYPARERYNALPDASDAWGGMGAMGNFETPNQDYWDEDNPSANYNRHRLNKILAKFLTHQNADTNAMGGEQQQFAATRYDFNDDNNVRNYLAASEPDEKKRSSYFRERETKYDSPMQSAFREREPYNHAELTDQFLREIEESKELDREQRYKEALRRLWEKYQQQENEIEGDLFEGQKRFGSTLMPSTAPANNYYIGPLMQKKRTYPVLPWLPARRKRFPVSKRSPSPAQTEAHFAETNEKVAQDLSELFGNAKGEGKEKRSPNENQNGHAHSEMIGAVGEEVEKKNKKEEANITTAAANSTVDSHLNHHKHNHRKRNDHDDGTATRHVGGDDDNDDNDDVDEDESEERDDHEEHENDDDDDEHEFEEDDEEEEQKKKRDIAAEAKTGPEVGDLANFRRKKSIQWSKYFGIDRRKKSTLTMPDGAKSNSDVRKRSASTDSPVATAGNDNDSDKRQKKDLDPRKLESMDRKLQSIEDLIIDETIKYTGAHEGIVDPDEIRRLKDHVVSRLATAYSLEKMRRSLEKLRQSIDKDNHLLYNTIEGEGEDDATRGHWNEINEALKKRLSVKKEKVQFHPAANGLSVIEKSKELQSNSIEGGAAMTANNDDNEPAPKKKKTMKKRTGYLRYPNVPNTINDFEDAIGTTSGQFEPLNDAYLGNKNYIFGSNQCPLIESMAERCRGVDLLSGDVHQKLLPICGVHRICYLCGVSQVGCDFQYLAEADTICGHNSECQSAARSVLMILRGSPGPQLGPKECLKNPCLYGAMREIGL